MSDFLGDSSETLHAPNRRKPKQKSLQLAKKADKEQNGREYPVDVWYHISRYIRPDQVQVFSLICRSAWLIASTSQFWLTLYCNYVSPSKAVLPTRLQRDYIDSRPGIKSRVIRALFHTYALFQQRSSPDSSCTILHRKCILFWWEKDYSIKAHSNTWTYYLKVANFDGVKDVRLNTVCFNPENGNSILRVKCPNYVYLPSVTGMVVTSFTVSMSTDMRYHQLKMVFHHERKYHKYHKNEGLVLVINPVMDTRIVQWWHPSYPNPLEK